MTTTQERKHITHHPNVVPRWPHNEAFVGREPALALAQRRLARDDVLVVTGPPGVGKTWLSARLGESYDESQRTWVDCQHFAANLTEIVWLIAHKLQDDDLWEFLEADRERPYPGVTRVGTVAGHLSQDKHLICFDGLHHAYDVPAIVALVRSLTSRAASGKTGLRVIVTAQHPPPFLSEFGYLVLPEIEPEATAALFERHAVVPSDELARAVHADLGGLPRLIDRAARQAGELFVSPEAEDAPGEPVAIDRECFDHDPLANPYLTLELVETFESLTRPKQLVLFAASVALFGDDAGGDIHPDLIKAALVGETTDNVRFTLYRLQSQGLVLSRAPRSRDVGLSPVMCRFCYDGIGPKMRRRLHRNLARHFDWEGDILNATRHYIAAGKTRRAAKFLIRFARYAESDGIAAVVDELLSVPPTRALPEDIQESLRQIRASANEPPAAA